MIISEQHLITAFNNTLYNYCFALYKGGSRVDPVINNPHDYDYIWFLKPRKRCFLQRELRNLGFKYMGASRNLKINKIKQSEFDCSQVRIYPYNSINWFSYLDILMYKVVGEDICPKTDIIIEHRNAFLKDLKEKAKLISNKTITNQKRWYHILRGIYILKNNSYEVSNEQRREINILHDLTSGWEKVRDKTIQLLNNLEG